MGEVMSEWLGPAIGAVVVALISATGAWGTTLVALKSKAKDDRQTLIDQIQEERDYQAEQRRLEREQFAAQLKAEREEIAAERAENAARVDRFWTDKALSRQHVAQLEDHIWQRKDPPPPTPPPGYTH